MPGKISEMTAATSLTGVELLEVVQGGATKSATVSLILGLVVATSNTFTAAQTISPSAVTGASATASLAIAQEWNTTGAPSAIDVNVTQNLVGNAASFFTARKGSTRYFDVRAADAYSGVGTATQGGPRVTLGTNAPSNDDSALLICRNVIGQNLFSHAIRDESIFDGMNGGGIDAGYASFDGAASYSNSPNHFHTFQSRPTKTGASTVGQMVSFIHQPVVAGGTVSNVYGALVKNTTGAGTVTNQYGLYVEPLSKGGTANWGLYVAGANPSYFGGSIQVAGAQTFTGVMTCNNTASFNYSDNSFARGFFIRNTNTGTTAICGFQLRDSSSAGRGGVDFFPANYASTALQNSVVFNTLGTAKLKITSAADAGAGSGTEIAIRVGGSDTDSLTFAASTGVPTFNRKVNFLASATGAATMNIPSGTAPTTPVSGDLWYNGTNLQFRDGATTRTITWV